MTKPTKWHVRPAKTQINLGIRPVWSESSLCAQWVATNPSFLYADSKDWSDWADAQADLSLRWAHMPLCRFCHALALFTLASLNSASIPLRLRFVVCCVIVLPFLSSSRRILYFDKRSIWMFADSPCTQILTWSDALSLYHSLVLPGSMSEFCQY